MKAPIAMIAGALLTLTTAAFAETTANNSGKQLESLQATPQGAADTGYFVASGSSVAVAKPAKAKAKPQR